MRQWRWYDVEGADAEGAEGAEGAVADEVNRVQGAGRADGDVVEFAKELASSAPLHRKSDVTLNAAAGAMKTGVHVTKTLSATRSSSNNRKPQEKQEVGKLATGVYMSGPSSQFEGSLAEWLALSALQLMGPRSIPVSSMAASASAVCMYVCMYIGIFIYVCMYVF